MQNPFVGGAVQKYFEWEVTHCFLKHTYFFHKVVTILDFFYLLILNIRHQEEYLSKRTLIFKNISNIKKNMIIYLDKMKCFTKSTSKRDRLRQFLIWDSMIKISSQKSMQRYS